MACMQSGGTHEGVSARRGRSFSLRQERHGRAQPKAALFSPEKLSKSPATAGKPSSAEIASDAAASLVAPPRTISDITAILEQQKPDLAEIAKLTARADAAVPAAMKGAELADFVYQRAQAKALLAGLTRSMMLNLP